MTDPEFLAAFEAAAIPNERWTHLEHVRMAFLYLREHPFETALERMRGGIQKLNRANGIEQTPTRGYHETVTVAWAHIVASCVAHHGSASDFAAFADANPHLCTRSLLRLFYTRDRILGVEARLAFVAPDLALLPRIS